MTNSHLHEENHLKVLRLLADRPEISQRELARELGISLGKTNYCLRALLTKGWIKMQNFASSRNKLAYAYLVTPEGLAEKAGLTAQFLQRKVAEYDDLRREIAALQAELAPRSASEPEPHAARSAPGPDTRV
jgi:EPS-associated MarR family transcriptional regulator